MRLRKLHLFSWPAPELSPAVLHQSGKKGRTLIPDKNTDDKASPAPLTVTKIVSHGVALAISCAITSALVLNLYPRIGAIAPANLFLAMMWATVATVFVQHIAYVSTAESAVSRLVATGISFALCLLYLLIFPFHIWGLALLIGLGSIITTLVGRPNETITTGITTTVVMVVAAMSPEHRWEQPLLRLGDTVVGTVVGITIGWIEAKGLTLYYSGSDR